MDAASRTWPPPTPSPPPFSSRLRVCSDPHRRRHSKKQKPVPPPPTPKNAPDGTGAGADFSALPPELVHQAAALHARGRRVKHGPAAGGGEGREARGGEAACALAVPAPTFPCAPNQQALSARPLLRAAGRRVPPVPEKHLRFRTTVDASEMQIIEAGE